MIPAICIFAIFLTVMVLILYMPLSFSGIIDDSPEKFIEGNIKGLRLCVKTKYYSLDETGQQAVIKDNSVRLSLRERFNLTFALLNPMFDVKALENYTHDPQDVIASVEESGKYWKEIYASCDLDQDGKITRREFADWLVLCSTPWGALREKFY